MNLATRADRSSCLVSGVLLVGCLFVGPLDGHYGGPCPPGWRSGARPSPPLHGNGVKYEIPLENITDTQLLDTLPPSYRVVGTGMDTYLEGDFSVAGARATKFCPGPHRPAVPAGGGRWACILVHRRDPGADPEHGPVACAAGRLSTFKNTTCKPLNGALRYAWPRFVPPPFSPKWQASSLCHTGRLVFCLFSPEMLQLFS